MQQLSLALDPLSPVAPVYARLRRRSASSVKVGGWRRSTSW